MPPKKKPVAVGESGSNRRMNSESSSSEAGESMDDSDHKLAMDIAQRRTTRQSARTCMLKNRGDSLVYEEMMAREDQKPKDVSFDYQELLNDPAYNKPELYKSMEPEDFNMDYYHRTGLNEVLKFSCPPEKLGMKMVDDRFSVDDVEELVGGDRVITVAEVTTQQSEDMPLKKFIDFYKNGDRPQPDTPKDDKKRTLYNVLSLEFSNTALTDLVQSPSLVRQIDWASSWPDERKMRSLSFEEDGTFSIQNLYPRVENYCLMSPSDSFTGFHIDFHGSSVWYHVKRGKKIFWIIEPTEQNLKMYEDYERDPESSAFFGTIVETCARVEVLPGNTLIIPSGWIHAVYTPEDSLVFGGNFLHTRSALMQLNVLQGENRIGINKKYRYLYSEEVVFFYLNKVVKSVTGRQYIRPMTRNLQHKYYEYVGEQFREKNMHHRVPLKSDYDDNGIAWKQQWEETKEYIESKAKLAKWDGNGKEENENENDDKKDDGDYDGMAVLSQKNEVNEDEKKIDVKVEEKDSPKFGEHDDMFIDDVTFYHPVSFNLDAGRGATAVHTRPLSMVEPRMKISKAALKNEISPLEVAQWEGLVVNLLKKSKVDVPDGLTRPNSLIQAFCALLRYRRRLVEDEEGIKLARCVLPSREGSRRMHEEQKRAATERKRKKEEKKMKIEEGDGEKDTDWTGACEQPKKKKTRKSEEVGNMGWFSREMDEKPKKEREEERDQNMNSSPYGWKQSFLHWFAHGAGKGYRGRENLARVIFSTLYDRRHSSSQPERKDLSFAVGRQWDSANCVQRRELFMKYCHEQLKEEEGTIVIELSGDEEEIDRIVEDRGLKVIPLGGEEKNQGGRSPTRKPSSSQFSSSDIPPPSLTTMDQLNAELIRLLGSNSTDGN